MPCGVAPQLYVRHKHSLCLSPARYKLAAKLMCCAARQCTRHCHMPPAVDHNIQHACDARVLPTRPAKQSGAQSLSGQNPHGVSRPAWSFLSTYHPRWGQLSTHAMNTDAAQVTMPKKQNLVEALMGAPLLHIDKNSSCSQTCPRHACADCGVQPSPKTPNPTCHSVCT